MLYFARRLFVLFPLFIAVSSQALSLVEAGKSPYRLYLPKAAPASVHEAGAELQRCFREVTGVELAVADAPRGALIVLGDCEVARAAGIEAEDLPLESFRVVLKKGNLFILGPDTPDGETTAGNGISAGTANGVYSFLERFLGVRWLMPGENGTYFPRRADISLPDDLDWSEEPGFLNRRLPYIQERKPLVKTWWRRQKLGYSLMLYHSHNWRRTIPPEQFRDHPEWFAEHGGKRVPATGRYKLCLSSEGMIQEYARRSIEFFKANPQRSCYSLSPSDSAGWCECAACRKMYETDPNGKLSVTPAVIQFYNRVAEIVAPECPGKMLAGYIYAAYVFPPQKPFKLHPAVFLVWAPSFDYGYTLYRPALRKQWDELAPQWMAVTENIAYYDLPNCTHNSMGAPNTPGIGILEFLYPRLKKLKMKGVYVYGSQAWGHAALCNYLLAKLAWNPEADIRSLAAEFCDKAYGKGGGEILQFYQLLDAETSRFYQANPTETYNLSKSRLHDVYAKNLPELERLYSAAAGKITDPQARARLEMLGVNLKILHWNLRKQKLPAAADSCFAIDDQQFIEILTQYNDSVVIAPPKGKNKTLAKRLRAKFAVSVPPKSPKNAVPAPPAQFRGTQLLLLKPMVDGEVKITFKPVRLYGSLIWGRLYNEAGKALKSVPLSRGSVFSFAGESKNSYRFAIECRADFFHLEVENARWAVDTRLDDKGLHLRGDPADLWFVPPVSAKQFEVWLSATPPGETAAGRLLTSEGREAATFDCVSLATDVQRPTVGTGEDGLWRCEIRAAKTGTLDDVYLRLDKRHSGFVSPVPEQALLVEKKGK